MNARRLFVFALTLSLAGCATSGGGGDEQDTSRVHQAVAATTLEIQLPLEAPLSRLGLVGLTSVTLRNQTSVEGLTLSNASLTVGIEAKTGDLWANGGITVGERGAVTGDAVARDTISIPSTTPVSGTSYPNSAFTMQPRMQWSYTLPASYSADVTANAGETKSASPARYRNITAQGTVKLSAGNYFVDNMTLNSGGKLQIPGDGPAPVIYVFNTLTYQGTITDSNAKGERPVIVYLGTTASTIQTQLDFSLIAPNAAVTLAALNGGVKHRGSVIAKQLELAASAQFAARPSNALVPMLAKDPQACSDMIAADASLAHPERERQRLSEVARYCMGFGTQCEADLVAKVNLDYHLAALQLASGTSSPAQYLALSRDRTRKRAAVAQTAAELCNAVNADSDGDLITNAKDACPNTPALTPTKDNGCTDNTLPSAPPASDVSKALGKITLLGSKYCQGAPSPTVPTFLRFVPFLLGWHDLELGRVGNQPAGCPVYYHIQVESLDISTGKTKSFSTLFQDSESMDPSTAPTVTFRVAGTNDANRTAISTEIYGAAYSDPSNIRFVRARAMATSGAGARSDWGQWSSWY